MQTSCTCVTASNTACQLTSFFPLPDSISNDSVSWNFAITFFSPLTMSWYFYHYGSGSPVAASNSANEHVHKDTLVAHISICRCCRLSEYTGRFFFSLENVSIITLLPLVNSHDFLMNYFCIIPISPYSNFQHCTDSWSYFSISLEMSNCYFLKSLFSF